MPASFLLAPDSIGLELSGVRLCKHPGEFEVLPCFSFFGAQPTNQLFPAHTHTLIELQSFGRCLDVLECVSSLFALCGSGHRCFSCFFSVHASTQTLGSFSMLPILHRALPVAKLASFISRVWVTWVPGCPSFSYDIPRCLS